jgi:hypothetical protein
LVLWFVFGAHGVHVFRRDAELDVRRVFFFHPSLAVHVREVEVVRVRVRGASRLNRQRGEIRRRPLFCRLIVIKRRLFCVGDGPFPERGAGPRLEVHPPPFGVRL